MSDRVSDPFKWKKGEMWSTNPEVEPRRGDMQFIQVLKFTGKIPTEVAEEMVEVGFLELEEGEFLLIEDGHAVGIALLTDWRES